MQFPLFFACNICMYFLPIFIFWAFWLLFSVCPYYYYYYYYYYCSWKFFHITLRVFHWSLSDSKSPQVSKTLLSILADLNNIIIWMVSSHLLISKSSNPCTLHLSFYDCTISHLFDEIKWEFFQTAAVLVLMYGCTSGTLSMCKKKKAR